MRTITTTVYQFDELNDSAKQKAIENLYDINTSFDWWENVYEDAKNIGFKITDFVLNGSINYDIVLSASEVCANIFRDHGCDCNTYNLAENFMENFNPIFATYLETEEGEDKLTELENEFFKDLGNEYLYILQSELEYLESYEATLETIQANEYEFTEDGKLC